MAQVILDISTRTPDAALGRTGQKLRSVMQDTVKTSKETEKLGKSYKTLEKGMTQLKAGFASLNSGLSKMTLLTGGTSLALGNLIHSSWDMGKRIMEMRAEMKHLSDSQGDVNQAWGVAIKAWSAPGTLASLQTIKGVMNGLAQSGMQVGGAMADLTKFLGDVHQASGLSIDSIAKLTGEMHSYWGVSTKGAREVVSSVLAAQKVFGSTTAQMEQMVGVINKAQSNLGAFFKDGEKGSKALAKGITVASGAMMKFGVNAQTATDFMDKLLDPERFDETSAVLRRLGITIDDQIKMMESAEGKDFFFDKLLENLPKLSREIQAIQNPFARISYAKALGLPAEIASKMANASTSQMRGLIEEYKSQAEGEKAAAEKRKKAQADAQRIEEQMMFLKMKILGPMINFVMDMYGKIMKSGLMKKASTVMQRIVGAVAGFLKVFQPVIDLLAGNTKEIGPALISMAKGAFEFIHKQITVLYEKLKPYLIQFLKEAAIGLLNFIVKHPIISGLIIGGVFLKFKNSVIGFSTTMHGLIKESKIAMIQITKATAAAVQRITMGGKAGSITAQRVTLSGRSNTAATEMATMMPIGKTGGIATKAGRFSKLSKFGKFAPLALLATSFLPELLSTKKEGEDEGKTGGPQKAMELAGTGLMAAQFGPMLASKIGIKGGAGIAAKAGASVGMKAIPVVGTILSALAGGFEAMEDAGKHFGKAQLTMDDKRRKLELSIKQREGGLSKGETAEFKKLQIKEEKSKGTGGEKAASFAAGAATLGIGPLVDKLFGTEITPTLAKGFMNWAKDVKENPLYTLPIFYITKKASDIFAEWSETEKMFGDKKLIESRKNEKQRLEKELKTMKDINSERYKAMQKRLNELKTMTEEETKTVGNVIAAGLGKIIGKIASFFTDDGGIGARVNVTFFIKGLGTRFEKLLNDITLWMESMLQDLITWTSGTKLGALMDLNESEEKQKSEFLMKARELESSTQLENLRKSAGFNYEGVQTKINQLRELEKLKQQKETARIELEKEQLEAMKDSNKKLESINRTSGLGADYQRQTVEQLKGKELKETDFLQTFLGSYGAVSLSTRTS